jgi:hypothetical protein
LGLQCARPTVSKACAQGYQGIGDAFQQSGTHTQEIIPAGWQRIVMACSRFEQNLETIGERLRLLKPPYVS